MCLRRPSPTAAQLEDHREESINFYGGLVQRSHREANFSPQERSSLAGTPCDLPLHDATSCSAPRRLEAATSAREAGVAVSSPFLSLAAVEDDTSWMNTTTTMVGSSCSPSTPIDWWKVDSSMFMDEGGTHITQLKAALATAQGSCNSSSDSTGERFPLNARKTASADVCRLELDKSPRRRSFGADGGCHPFLSAPSTAHDDHDHDEDDDDEGLHDELSALTTPLFLPEVDWTNETCIGGGLDFSSSIVVTSADEQRLLQQQQQHQQHHQQHQQQEEQHQHLWISSPASSSSNITDSELERRLEDYDYKATREEGQQKHLLSFSQLGGNNSSGGSVGGATAATLERTIDCNNLLLTGGAKAKEEEGELPLTATIFSTGSPVSLHEEIEQLSSGFDCDATNHLVSTGPSSAAQLSFIADDEQDHFQQHGPGGGDALSLNIFKWLQEDISSSILADKQEPSSAAAAANTNLLEAADLTSGVSYLLATDSTEIPFSPSPASHLLRQPVVLEEPFVNSLDQLQTLHRTTPASGAGGGHKTAIKSNRGKNSHTTAATTTTTNTSTVNPQYDHNYFTMKRRNQDSGDHAHNLKPKMLKLSNDQQERQPTTSRYTAAKDSWRTHQPDVAATQATANTTTTNANITKTLERKPSVAHRKAPTLKVHLGGGGAQPPSLLSMQDPFLPLNKTLHPVTTTTTTTTTGSGTANNIFGQHHRLPPLATLNTPDLTNDILDLEDEKFDLLSFIDTNDDSLDLNKYNSVVDEKPTLDDVLPSASRKEEEEETEQKVDTANGSANSSSSTTTTSSSKDVKDSTETKIYQLLTLDSLRQLTASTEASEGRGREAQASTSSPSAHRAQHNHLSQYGGSNTNSNCSIGSRSSASSVCGDSDVSSNTTTTQMPKRRGRPPKAVGTVRDRSQYEHLSEADWRYREQRDKNNEASRKSRINRKDRELKLESEADRLNLQHQKLSYEERRLQRDCQKWRKAVMKLALL
ncbi:AGAP000528-PA-like protein [Anopheles sinensis]|uniref:AGAP000528-PA-like protein n=1 Tax=Anopheles sinensis TaxID=74873 RepID=A0A084VIW1_ANOSI|nr:AGAP000528-PA-like protein [Anopheles sinensis]